MTCKDCQIINYRDAQIFAEIQLCPKHALVDRLAEALRWKIRVGTTVSHHGTLCCCVDCEEADNALAEYDGLEKR